MTPGYDWRATASLKAPKARKKAGLGSSLPFMAQLIWLFQGPWAPVTFARRWGTSCGQRLALNQRWMTRPNSDRSGMARLGVDKCACAGVVYPYVSGTFSLSPAWPRQQSHLVGRLRR